MLVRLFSGLSSASFLVISALPFTNYSEILPMVGITHDDYSPPEQFLERYRLAYENKQNQNVQNLRRDLLLGCYAFGFLFHAKFYPFANTKHRQPISKFMNDKPLESIIN